MHILGRAIRRVWTAANARPVAASLTVFTTAFALAYADWVPMWPVLSAA
jgi:hypothetical protein